MKIFLILGFLLFQVLVCSCAPYANVSQLIEQQGYPVENYWVQTTDGFLLSIVRIPHGKNENSGGNAKPVVFLQHGLLDTSATWVLNNAQESLGFILADAGFDVYLGNVRGNTYSSQNVIYNINSKEFWDLVDFDNMISIDLPTMINHALKISGKSSLVYIGHSQGTLMGFGGFPLNPELAEKVDLFIALAPVAYVYNQESRLLTLLAGLDLPEWMYWLGEKSFLPSDWIIRFLAETLCVEDPIACADVVFMLCGTDRSNLNNTRLYLYMEHTPGGTSVRNMMHWAQAVETGKFRMFDYGSVAANIQHYNETTPPEYHPENLTKPPLALITGTVDELADPKDVAHLISQLPESNKPVVVLNEPTYDHLDFVWGENAYQLIYPTVVQLAQKYAKL